MTTHWCIIGLLLTAPAAAAQAPAQAAAPDGKALYEKDCRMCHGAQGVPADAMVKMMGKIPTFNAAFATARSQDSVVKDIEHGVGKMKGFKDKLSHDEIVAVAKYVREFGEKAKPAPK
jgi:mono/diheme cytochrome c family protein